MEVLTLDNKLISYSSEELCRKNDALILSVYQYSYLLEVLIREPILKYNNKHYRIISIINNVTKIHKVTPNFIDIERNSINRDEFYRLILKLKEV